MTKLRTPGNNLSVTINKLSMSYNDNGPQEAPVIIFIHGFPFNKTMWSMQEKALKERFRVISYDIRGHGDSGSGKEKFSIELFVSDLMALIETLSLDNIILCGLSMGGYIALRAAENYPGRFDGLVLSDTQCSADSDDAREKRMNAFADIRDNGTKKYTEDTIKNVFSSGSFITRKAAVASVREMILNTSADSICNTLQALATRKETCGKLNYIDIPVLIMVGKEDKITPPTTARILNEKIQDSCLNIIEDAGHMANLENPMAFNMILDKFCSSFLVRAYA